jgi:dipeptidase D
LDKYKNTECDILIDFSEYSQARPCFSKADTQKIVEFIRKMPTGVYKMSNDVTGLVETSSNLASIHHTDGQVVVAKSQRSSIGSARENMSQVVAAALQLGGAKTDIGEGYPGWKMNPNSVILKVATDSYRRLFGKEPLILAIHAGLECGLFSEKYPGLDMISVGPTLRGVHSPEERLHIPSVDLVWQHLLDILKHIPA